MACYATRLLLHIVGSWTRLTTNYARPPGGRVVVPYGFLSSRENDMVCTWALVSPWSVGGVALMTLRVEAPLGLSPVTRRIELEIRALAAFP